MPGTDLDLSQLFRGDRRALARAISLIENDEADASTVWDAVFARTGHAYRVGITGPPGAGKSTITNKLARLFRGREATVGIIAVDPTSPFTGGALLGDRVRMTDVELDGGVFIRSMASRGSVGGLSRRAVEAADVLDAAGMDVVIMETVGVGQSELDIARAVDSTIVVLVPESGDAIQAMKAGLMEIADAFVVNKADRPGAEQATHALQMMIGFRHHEGWVPPVQSSIASEGKGIAEIAATIDHHRAYLQSTGLLVARRKERLQRRVMDLAAGQLQSELWTENRRALLARKLEEIWSTRTAPSAAAKDLVEHFRQELEGR